MRVPGSDFVGDFFVRGDRESGEVVAATRTRIAVIPLRDNHVGEARWLPPFEQGLSFVRPNPRALAWAGGEGGVFLVAADGRHRRVLPAGERAWPHHEPDWPGFDLLAPARDYPARHGAILLPFDAAIAAFEQRAAAP